jgi:hypothetical protein
MSRPRFRKRYPELAELTDMLEAMGLENGGAQYVVLALAKAK